MESLVIAAAALACPIGMGAMMWFMAKGTRGNSRAQTPVREPSLAELRDEHRRLGEEIERLEADREPTRVP